MDSGFRILVSGFRFQIPGFRVAQSGRQKMETFAFASAVRGYHVFEDLFKPSIGETLVAKQEFNSTMDKHAGKVVKGNEMVSHLPSKFSQIVWYMYFLAHSGEISVEVIGRRRCGRVEVILQLELI